MPPKEDQAGPSAPANKNLGPPDGGWGWVVVFASACTMLISDGVSYSFSVIFQELRVEFNRSSSITNLSAGLFLALPLLIGPFCSAMVDRYGCVRPSIIGAIIAASGVFSSAFSPNLEIFILCFGVIGGLGLGVSVVVVVVGIAYWFDTHVNVANGISSSGSGLGTFVFAPMVRYFMDNYGTRGGLILVSGVMLNLCVVGSLMREPVWWIKHRQKKLEKLREKNKKIKEAREKAKRAAQEAKSKKTLPEPSASSSSTRKQRGLSRTFANFGGTDDVRPFTGPMVYPTAALAQQRQKHANRISRASFKAFMTEEYPEVESETKALLKTMCNFSLFCESKFLCFAISIVLIFTWFTVPVLFLEDYMVQDGGIDKQSASFLTSAIGIGNTIGMLFFGYIGDFRFIHRSALYSTCLVIGGLSIIGVTFTLPSYWPTFACACSFGFFFASCYAYVPVILMEMIPMQRYNQGWGLTLLCEGIGNLIGPVLAGYIRDITEHWTLSFQIAGGMFLLASFFVFLLTVTKNRMLCGMKPYEPTRLSV